MSIAGRQKLFTLLLEEVEGSREASFVGSDIRSVRGSRFLSYSGEHSFSSLWFGTFRVRHFQRALKGLGMSKTY